MAIDRDAILKRFLEESEDRMRGMEESLVSLEERPKDKEVLNGIFRNMHRLKGDAHVLDLIPISEFAHTLEDLLERIRGEHLPVSSHVVTMLFRGMDVLRDLLCENVRRPIGLPAEDGGGAAPGSSAEKTRSIRVSVDKLDSILDLTCEIAASGERLGQGLREGCGFEEAQSLHADAGRLCRNLQEAVMKARMVPLMPLFRHYTRTVRDLSQALGKRACLSISGEDVEVDTAMSDGLRDPLTHLLRNALDHGLESPGQRESAGKNSIGKIGLTASQGADGIMIQVSDDGGGLPREAILQRARSLGLAKDTDRLSDAELFAMVFLPGFSTSQAVTTMSGRGVGLDIVQRNMESLRGTVEVESVEGQGTTFTLRLPLTTAIIQGFLVGVSGRVYVIPLESVVECSAFSPQGFRRDRCGILSLRGRPIPFVHLGRLLHVPLSSVERESVVFVQQEARTIGVVVDELFGSGQVVIKPLPDHFNRLPGVSGTTIMGDGKVALVLDMPSLLRKADTGKELSPV